jgi:hypothetical protein
LYHFNDLSGKDRVLSDKASELCLAQFDGNPEEESKLIRKRLFGLFRQLVEYMDQNFSS